MLRRIALAALLLAQLGCQAYSGVDEIENKIELHRYLEHISKKIEIIGASRYPELYKLVTQVTQVEIEMRIRKNGELSAAKLIQSSNNPQLDAAMLDIIHYAAPHPPIPDELHVKALKINKTWMLVPVNK